MTEETNPHKHQEERLRTLLQTVEKVQPRAGLFSKVWHSNSKYRRVIYQCNSKFKNEHSCSTPHLYEPEIQQKFLQAFARYFGQREVVIRSCRFVLNQRKNRMLNILKILETSESILEAFDENVWNAVLENLTVFHDGSMVFLFKDGTEIKI